MLATGLFLPPPAYICCPVFLPSSSPCLMSDKQASWLPSRPLYSMPLIFIGGPHPLHSLLCPLRCSLVLWSFLHYACCPKCPSPCPFPVYAPSITASLSLSLLSFFYDNIGLGDLGKEVEEGKRNFRICPLLPLGVS